MFGFSDVLPYLLVSALFFLIAVPLAAGWIKPNRLYGVRTRTTLQDADAWYRCNRVFGAVLMLTSTSYALVVGYCSLHDIVIGRAALFIAFLLEVAIPVCLCLLTLKSTMDH